MAQYTYSFLYSEFQRIAIQLRANLNAIVAASEADEATKKLVSDVCGEITVAVDEICEYSKDQLKIW
ncbi:MAG: hypothetical protein ACI4PC_09010 [Oscillospiraceae bacterium]